MTEREEEDLYWQKVDEETAARKLLFSGLSAMTRNALWLYGITTKEAAAEWLASGKKLQGVGKDSVADIRKWLGVGDGRKDKTPLTAASIPRAIALLEAHGYTVNPPAPAAPPASTNEVTK